MHSCLYEGTVTHRRHEPVTHEFQYRLFMAWLDLDELSLVVGRRGLIADRRHASCAFLRSDHLFDNSRCLSEEVRDIIFRQTGQASCGPIRLLTQLRYCGFYMSPLNLFYVYDELDRRVEFVVAEVSNTPWNERHCYVLWGGNRSGGAETLEFRHGKDFHVSPFMGMDLEYRWRLNQPGADLTAQLLNVQHARPLFDANMAMRRRELTTQWLRRMTLRYPLMTAQISAAIYYQAFQLWWKKCPCYTHPKKQDNRSSLALKKRRRSNPQPGSTTVVR